jgi:hypothetical protein
MEANHVGKGEQDEQDLGKDHESYPAPTDPFWVLPMQGLTTSSFSNVLGRGDHSQRPTTSMGLVLTERETGLDSRLSLRHQQRQEYPRISFSQQ